jgi:predicted DNA-binding protein with PD1-like motif
MFKKIHVFRLKPKEELIGGIAAYCDRNNISSAVVLGIIGSLEKAKLNYLVALPGKYITKEFSGHLEIVCAQGSVAMMGEERIIHIHVQLGELERNEGGHLAEATVFSTAEVVIGELDYQLTRIKDDYTGLNELTK